jgi:chemotaxis methyl-accepting protein methylase
MTMTQQYRTTTEQVPGGYDLIISDGSNNVTLFIYDKEQAAELSERLISIAIKQKLDLNSAAAIFNQGCGMFNDS